MYQSNCKKNYLPSLSYASLNDLQITLIPMESVKPTDIEKITPRINVQ